VAIALTFCITFDILFKSNNKSGKKKKKEKKAWCSFFQLSGKEYSVEKLLTTGFGLKLVVERD